MSVDPARVHIRPAAKADLPDVLRLYAQPSLDEGAVLPIEEAQRIFDRYARYPDYVLYVAELDGNVVGTFSVSCDGVFSYSGTRTSHPVTNGQIFCNPR